jgi:branched-subunit amino acid ABC-type transport system permease component
MLIRRAMRALAQDREVTHLMGVNVDRIAAYGFALGAALAGLAGGLLVTVFGVNSGVGNVYSIKAFIMIMIGGAGVVPGAILGAVVLRCLGNFLDWPDESGSRSVRTCGRLRRSHLRNAVCGFLLALSASRGVNFRVSGGSHRTVNGER